MYKLQLSYLLFVYMRNLMFLNAFVNILQTYPLLAFQYPLLLKIFECELNFQS